MLFLCGSWKVSRIGFVLDGVYCPLDHRTVVLITQDESKVLKIKPFLALRVTIFVNIEPGNSEISQLSVI